MCGFRFVLCSCVCVVFFCVVIVCIVVFVCVDGLFDVFVCDLFPKCCAWRCVLLLSFVCMVRVGLFYFLCVRAFDCCFVSLLYCSCGSCCVVFLFVRARVCLLLCVLLDCSRLCVARVGLLFVCTCCFCWCCCVCVFFVFV